MTLRMRIATLGIAALSVVTSLLGASTAMAVDVGYGFYSGAYEGTYGSTYDLKMFENGLYEDNASSSKEALIGFINKKLNAGGKESLSARYIVFNMLGVAHTSGGHTKTLSDTQLLDWYARIRQPGVTIAVSNYAATINTGYTSRYNGDIFAFIEPVNAPTMLFYYNGNLVYAIKMDCANPVGGLAGLPSGWSANGTSAVSQATATAGQTVTFTHTITNTGASPFRSLTWFTGWAPAPNSNTAIDRGGVDLDPGASKKVSSYDFKLPMDGKPGTKYCQAVFFARSDSDISPRGTEYACVTLMDGKPYWDVNPFSTVTDAGGGAISSAKPGDTIYFTHTLKNVGAKNVNGLQYLQKWGDGSPTNPSDPVKTVDMPASSSKDVVVRESYRIPTTASAGSKICQTVSNIDNELVNAQSIPLAQKLQTSTPACVTIGSVPPGGSDQIYSFYTGGRTPVVPGEQATWQHYISIANLPSTQSGSFDHMDIIIHRTIDGQDSTTAISSSNPNGWQNAYQVVEDQINRSECSWFEYKLYTQTWGWVSYQSGVDAKGNPVYSSSYQYTGSTLTRSGSSQGSYGSGVTQCVDIGKRPKFQVWGNDLRTLANVQATWMRPDGDSTPGAPYYGSWSEYGILAMGSVFTTGNKQNVSSGARATLSTSDLTTWHPLTFSNVPSSVGGYSMTSEATQLDASFRQWYDGAPSISAVTPGMPGGVYRASSLNIGDLSLGVGNSYVIMVDGDVTINGNITYKTGPYSAASLPQLVIVASGNINIAENVTRIDSWLIAKSGTLNTCNVGGSLSASICNKQLRINGPVAVNRIIMNRTYGSDKGTSGEPAEIYNYSSDAMAWLRAFSADRGRIRSVYTVEVPVRY